jgi:hypothetical protein
LPEQSGHRKPRKRCEEQGAEQLFGNHRDEVLFCLAVFLTYTS